MLALHQLPALNRNVLWVAGLKREIQLKNNQLPLSAALDQVFHDSTSQNDWPVIFAKSLFDN
jgi:hypothetical protein